MKKQLFLLGCVATLSFAACNDSGTDTTTAKDSTTTTTTQTNTERRGAMIANFDTRKFMDLKTNKPVKLHWDTVHYYYVDDSGTQPYYYYDPIAKDTFDYWGRRLNGYITSSNGDYMLDESRMPAMDMSAPTMDTASTSTSGDMKIKSKDDMYKEKTDSSKLKITDDKMKVKKK
ncbi:MAG: hypothetical protein ABIQ07_00370 [Ginsengibacter sp.]